MSPKRKHQAEEWCVSGNAPKSKFRRSRSVQIPIGTKQKRYGISESEGSIKERERMSQVRLNTTPIHVVKYVTSTLPRPRGGLDIKANRTHHTQTRPCARSDPSTRTPGRGVAAVGRSIEFSRVLSRSILSGPVELRYRLSDPLCSGVKFVHSFGSVPRFVNGSDDGDGYVSQLSIIPSIDRSFRTDVRT